MPRRRPRVCARDGCHLVTDGATYCAEHAPRPWAGSTRSSRLPADWPARRRAVLERDGHRCTHVDDDGNRCTARATEVDHVDPGDDHRLENLTSLCTPHHARKSSAEGHAARWRRL